MALLSHHPMMSTLGALLIVTLSKVTLLCFITLCIPKREAGKPGMISLQFANIYSCVQSDCGVCRAYASIALGKPYFNSKK